MANIPLWLRGRDIAEGGVFSITLQAVNALTGVLTPSGSAVSMIGNWDDIGIDSTPEVEEISSADATRQNDVILKERTEFTITEILKRKGTNILAAANVSGDYFYVALARGGQAWGFYGLRGAYNESIGKGKSTGRWTLTMVDPATLNPVYVSS